MITKNCTSNQDKPNYSTIFGSVRWTLLLRYKYSIIYFSMIAVLIVHIYIFIFPLRFNFLEPITNYAPKTTHYDWKLVWHQLSWDKGNKLPWRRIKGELSFYKFTVWLLCKTCESLYLTNRQQFSLVSTFVDHRNDVKLFKTQVEHCKVLQKIALLL